MDKITPPIIAKLVRGKKILKKIFIELKPKVLPISL